MTPEKFKKLLPVALLLILLLAAAGFIFNEQVQQKLKIKQQKQQDPLGELVVYKTDLYPEVLARYQKQFALAKQDIGKRQNDLAAWITVGQLKLWVGDLAGAERAWLYISELSPKNELSFANLGYLYAYERHDYVQGEIYYLKAQENNPKNIQYYRDLATIYQATNQREKGENILLAAQEQLPDNIDVYTMAGEYYKGINDIAKALAAYQQALKLDPQNAAIKQEIAQLKSSL